MKRLLFSLLLFLAALPAQQRPHNLILVTADGLRWQEVFRGPDPKLVHREDAGMKGAADVRQRFRSRSQLMPFLWSTIASDGVIHGNRDRGSEVRVRNRHRFSYPGYSEILTGQPQDDVIDSNDNRPNPSTTVLEILRAEWDLPPTGVALFGSWSVFTGIGARTPGSILINAGFQALDLPNASPRLEALSQQQFELLTPWRTVRHDYITFEMAIEYLRTVQPRVLYIALGETDDWAHDHRYDRYLESANYFDTCLRRLWEFIQADPNYRDRTTMLVTTDHGRGSNPSDWNSHGDDVPGAEHIWIAALGPGIPAAGEATNSAPLTQSDIAPTMLHLVGIDYEKLAAVEGKPIHVLKTTSEDVK